MKFLLFIPLFAFGSNCKDPWIKRPSHQGYDRLSDIRRADYLGTRERSLDQPVRGADEEEGSSFYEFVESKEPSIEEVIENDEFVERFYKALAHEGFADRQIEAVRLTGEGYNQSEIAKKFNVTRQAVSLWILKAKKVAYRFVGKEG